MIQFPCHCSYTFKLEDDMAGAMIQCPKCGRLNDIPTLSDLAHLADDGTYTLQEPVGEPEAQRLAKLKRIYSKSKVDEQGEAIDLRPTMDDVRQAGSEETPLHLQDQAPPAAPKYDPETGQLIRPIEVVPNPDGPPQVIPMAKPALHYAMGDFGPRLAPGRLLLSLLMPANFAVMFFMFLMHLFLWGELIVCQAGVWIAGFGLPPLLILLASHYGNIIDEVGPTGHNDLPRPGRDLSWHDDLWWPFVNVALALTLAYAPGIAAQSLPVPPLLCGWISGTLLALGTALVPALLLITTTSGTWLNLRPDRLLGVIRACGVNYVFAVFLWMLTLGIYSFGMGILLLPLPRGLQPLLQPYVVLPMLWVGIYLMHYLCCYLGLVYRAYHERFPWVLQRHEPTALRDRLGPRRPAGLRPNRHAPNTTTVEARRARMSGHD